MTTITQVDRNQIFDADGTLVAEELVEVDVTEEVVELSLHDALRKALADNAAHLAITSPTSTQNTAQIKRLTRQVNALVRLALSLDGARDLLVPSTDI